MTNDRASERAFLEFPLLRALFGRRARRFGLGMEIPSGPLAFKSSRDPVLASRSTDDRRDNFDIYLPLWLARHNKVIFGTLFAAGLVFTAALWWW